MNPTLSDPNNHAPELTPGDDWGDAEGHHEPHLASTAVLPPRRSVSDRPSVTAEAVVEVGLRIDSNVVRIEASDSPQRLEVQEISGGVVRLDQVAPAPPRIERQVKFHERPVQEKSEAQKQGEGATWGVAQRHSIKWIMGAGLSIVGIVTIGLLMLPSINESNKSRDDGGNDVSHAAREVEIEGLEAMNRLLAQQPEAMQIFRSYATANHWYEVVSLMREDQAKDESLRAYWKPMGVSKDWAPAVDSIWGVEKLGDDFSGVLRGELPNYSQFSAYFTRKGSVLLLDWKATTGFGTATFEQLKNGEGDPLEIRGKLSPADFYTALWPETEYQCYRFISPDEATIIWCYVKRTDAVNGEIAPHFNQGDIVQESLDALPITLRLQRGVENSQPNQWIISEVLHLGWAKP